MNLGQMLFNDKCKVFALFIISQWRLKSNTFFKGISALKS